MPNRHAAGFTLIELLVVISIIGVLASIVLASLGSARYAARNGRVAEDITQLRDEIEQSWTGTSYAALSQGPMVGVGPVTSIVEPNSFSDAKITTIINDILTENGGTYGGGSAGTDSSCGSSIPAYLADYNGGSVGLNGLTIYVYPSCGPVQKYAIYASRAPISLAYEDVLPFTKTAFAALMQPSPSNYSGYDCVDSSGNSVNTSKGWIPGYTGSDSSPVENNVSDGLCH